jgi:hypothetical protein
MIEQGIAMGAFDNWPLDASTKRASSFKGTSGI